MTDAPTPFSSSDIAASLSRHLAIYKTKVPTYQTVMMNDLMRLWQGRYERLLDIGGGTGVIAQLVSEFLPVETVESIDVVDRFCDTLTIPTHVYDGSKLPFANNSFNAATINNVLHHVPLDVRIPLMNEIRRVVAGPVYIKDHIAISPLDHARLAALDFIGNIPFGGMVKAEYLTQDDWQALCVASGYCLKEETRGTYRGGLYALVFPNRLETAMRWEPVA